jgi:hypothetical protein
MGKPNGDSISDLEKSDEATATLKVDPHGLPLVPQPSDFKDDPLVSDYLSSAQAVIVIPNRIHADSHPELAPMAEVDSLAAGQLHGLPGAVQRSCSQSQFR